VQRTFYGMIREFFLHVPPEYRAEIRRPLPDGEKPAGDSGAATAPGHGALVVLGSATAFKDLDGSFATYCARRFEREFGSGLVWLAAADFQPRAPGLDGYLPAGAGQKWPPDPRAWLRVARVRPGADNTAISGGTPTIQSRGNGRTYIESWLEALRLNPQWVFIDGWNSHHDGTAIAPSHEYGLQSTRLASCERCPPPTWRPVPSIRSRSSSRTPAGEGGGWRTVPVSPTAGTRGVARSATPARSWRRATWGLGIRSG
jgi:hypothetical protein